MSIFLSLQHPTNPAPQFEQILMGRNLKVTDYSWLQQTVMLELPEQKADDDVQRSLLYFRQERGAACAQVYRFVHPLLDSQQLMYDLRDNEDARKYALGDQTYAPHYQIGAFEAPATFSMDVYDPRRGSLLLQARILGGSQSISAAIEQL